MAIPLEIDQRIRNRFEVLVTESEELTRQVETDVQQSAPRGVSLSITRTKISLTGSSFDALKTKFLSLLHLLSDCTSEYISILITDVRQLTNTPAGVDGLVGKIQGLKDDYESGMLVTLVEIIETNVAADYLGQAEQLLEEGQSGKFVHVPSAVLLGAILEDALRRLCLRQTTPISVLKPNGESKTLNPLIDDLKKADVFNEAKAKQLRAWADIRNHAAHGRFDQFTRQDIEQMLLAVQTFLGDYL